ncbi:MAG: hypothetical protein R6T99_05590 [Bacteroidales bacterium]
MKKAFILLIGDGMGVSLVFSSDYHTGIMVPVLPAIHIRKNSVESMKTRISSIK